MFVKAYPAC